MRMLSIVCYLLFRHFSQIPRLRAQHRQHPPSCIFSTSNTCRCWLFVLVLESPQAPRRSFYIASSRLYGSSDIIEAQEDIMEKRCVERDGQHLQCCVCEWPFAWSNACTNTIFDEPQFAFFSCSFLFDFVFVLFRFAFRFVLILLGVVYFCFVLSNVCFVFFASFRLVSLVVSIWFVSCSVRFVFLFTFVSFRFAFVFILASCPLISVLFSSPGFHTIL